ncbi:MAG: hypothetical protein COV45_05395 [Deltaproteobacteria bacterium CG11_big_fil_rev_8_21_14_0_20_47_16]|nr:MAG: hypothetical protein COV45_05395 [Deltaproteobacteria bacterium CG11_big_fil_rev_8_21_14_0_20_47_16]
MVQPKDNNDFTRKLTAEVGIGAATTLIHTSAATVIHIPEGTIRNPFSFDSYQPSVVVNAGGEYATLDLGRYGVSAGLKGQFGYANNHNFWAGSVYGKALRTSDYDQYNAYIKLGASWINTTTQVSSEGNLAALAAVGVQLKLAPKWGVSIELGAKGVTSVQQFEGSVGFYYQPNGNSTPADKLAQKAEETLQTAKDAIQDIRKFSEYFVAGTSADIDEVLITIEGYVSWITDPNYTWLENEKSAKRSYIYIKRSIQQAVAYAIPATTYSKEWMASEARQVNQELVQLDTEVLYPVLQLLYLRKDSVSDLLDKHAKEIDKALYTDKDPQKAKGTFDNYKDYVKRTNELYIKIRNRLSPEQRAKMENFDKQIGCLENGDMCPNSESQNHSLPHFQRALEALIAEKGVAGNKAVQGDTK